jgi:hypothetical protein
MRVTSHPPWSVGYEPVGDVFDEVYHARLWLSVEVSEWGCRRQAHLHLVRAPDREDASWQRVDLAHHPLRSDPHPAPSPAAVDRIIGSLTTWLESWCLELYRQPDVGLVSELGESRADFRRRLRTAMGPEMQRRIQMLEAAPRPALPWRRRRAATKVAAFREQLAGTVSAVTERLDVRRLADPVTAVREAVVGILRLPSGTQLR